MRYLDEQRIYTVLRVRLPSALPAAAPPQTVHGTHCAGTALGAPPPASASASSSSAPAGRPYSLSGTAGMAPGARMVFFDVGVKLPAAPAPADADADGDLPPGAGGGGGNDTLRTPAGAQTAQSRLQPACCLQCMLHTAHCASRYLCVVAPPPLPHPRAFVKDIGLGAPQTKKRPVSAWTQ